MAALSGPLFAAALLLVVAGATKLLRPNQTRIALRQAELPNGREAVQLLGLAEVAIGTAAILAGGPVPAALAAIAYGGFAWFAVRIQAKTQDTPDCGCFGSKSAPVGKVHVGLNLAIAGICALAIAFPSDSVLSATNTPWAGVPFVALTLLLCALIYAALTSLPLALSAAAAHKSTLSHSHGATT